jgi:excinuclease UvrABC ATPase subunit
MGYLHKVRKSVKFYLAMDKIFIKGARQHNLKNIDVEIPRNSMVVITGPSGSGQVHPCL